MPGESEWLRARHQKTGSVDSLAEDVEHSLRLAASAAPWSSSLQYKYPIPEAAHTGAIVKLYPGTLSDANSDAASSDTLKSTEIVEFVGVLDYSVYSALTAVADEGKAGGSTDAPQPEQTKTLHAIYRVSEAESVSVGSLSPMSVQSGVRQKAIQHLAAALDGDAVAAEWLLLSLVGQM